MQCSKAALIAVLSFCLIGFIFVAGIAFGQQPSSPATTEPPQKGRPQPTQPPGPAPAPGQLPIRPPSPPPPDLGSAQAKRANVVRNHPGKIGGPIYKDHVRRHPHPGLTVVQNTNIVVVNNYYYVILPSGYPYYDGGYIDVDPQLDCYTWYDGDNLYEPGWYWTCD